MKILSCQKQSDLDFVFKCSKQFHILIYVFWAKLMFIILWHWYLHAVPDLGLLFRFTAECFMYCRIKFGLTMTVNKIACFMYLSYLDKSNITYELWVLK